MLLGLIVSLILSTSECDPQKPGPTWREGWTDLEGKEQKHLVSQHFPFLHAFTPRQGIDVGRPRRSCQFPVCEVGPVDDEVGIASGGSGHWVRTHVGFMLVSSITLVMWDVQPDVVSGVIGTFRNVAPSNSRAAGVQESCAEDWL